ncbi:MAG: hypothetical protein ACO1QB_04095 [Verrucomicrobiales bacterium]
MNTHRNNSHGFTRIDLLAVALVISGVAILPLAAFSKQETKGKSLGCLQNLSKLTKAWAAYAEDHDGTLLTSTSTNQNRIPWFTGSAGAEHDSTNPNLAIRQSPLMHYLEGNVEPWRCPSDSFKVRLNNGKLASRSRSYSMNDAFGVGAWLPNQVWRTYENKAQLVQPDKTWLFMEEHPNSINDGAMVVEMLRPTSRSGRIIDIPANWHNGATSFSFTDGHVELRKWRSKFLQKPLNYQVGILATSERDAINDLKWWSERTTVSRATARWE